MRHVLKLAATTAGLATVLLASLAAAAPGDLLFSEYVEGTSNNKALELFNPTGSPISLDASGYQVWLYFNGSTTATQMMPLTGTVPSLGTFVLAHPSADAAILAAADQVAVNTIWYNGDDVVALVRTGIDSVHVDVIGQIGVDPGTEWGAGDTSTADNTIRRNADVCQGDPDGSNVYDPSVEWSGFAVNTFGDLGAHTSTCTPVEVPATSRLSLVLMAFAMVIAAVVFSRRIASA